ncbi:hypothetical protein HN51_050171, partial [Arachis hypogaea]
MEGVGIARLRVSPVEEARGEEGLVGEGAEEADSTMPTVAKLLSKELTAAAVFDIEKAPRDHLHPEYAYEETCVFLLRKEKKKHFKFVTMKLKSKTEKCAVEKKRKRKPEKIGDVEIDSILNAEVDNGMQVGKEKKDKSSINRKRKNKDKNRRKGEVDLEEYSGELMGLFMTILLKLKKSKILRSMEILILEQPSNLIINNLEQVDEFITVHEENLEQERKEREERAAEGGWTVV